MEVAGALPRFEERGDWMPVVGETKWTAYRLVRVALAVFAAVVALVLMVVAPGGPTQAEAAKKPPRLEKMFNSRYCEIFGVSAIPTGGFSVQVFNTVGLGFCPQDKWDALDFSAIADSEGWFAAAPNGPRYWLMDTIIGAKPSNPKTFGGIPMRQVAMIETSTLQPQPFTEFTIQRRNTWVFNKGRTVHILTDPAGTRYVMQAYTKTVDPTLNPKTLKNLGTNPTAAIPEGWSFSSRILRKPLAVRADGEATILRDGVRSVYQKLG